jgi:hypothetical protein
MALMGLKCHVFCHGNERTFSILIGTIDQQPNRKADVVLFTCEHAGSGAAADKWHCSLCSKLGNDPSLVWNFYFAFSHAFISSDAWPCLDRLQVLRAQQNLKLVQYTCIALMVIEGFCIIIMAVFTVVQLLTGISQHRQALFSVFLAIPNRYLRALASKSVSIEEDDTHEEEGMQARSQPVAL